MTTEELQKIIDKSVGTKGPLKMHSFWLHKILSSIVIFFNNLFTNIDNINKTLNDSKIGNKPLHEITYNSRYVYLELEENKYNKLIHNNYYQLNGLDIYFKNSKDNTILNEYFLEFTTDNNTSIYMPDDIMWANGEYPEIEPNTTYQLSVVNGLGVLTKFM